MKSGQQQECNITGYAIVLHFFYEMPSNFCESKGTLLFSHIVIPPISTLGSMFAPNMFDFSVQIDRSTLLSPWTSVLQALNLILAILNFDCQTMPVAA